MMMTVPTYKNCVESVVASAPQVVLTAENEQRVARFLKNQTQIYLAQKNLKTLDRLDSWRKKRDTISGEVALEQFLGHPFVDLKLNEYFDYKSRGLFDSALRIKVFPAGTFPVIYKYNSAHMLFIAQEDIRTFRICGLAYPAQLNSFNYPPLLPESEMFHRERKTCFYGFYELRGFQDFQGLCEAFKRS